MKLQTAVTGAGIGIVSVTAIGSLAKSAAAQTSQPGQPTPHGGELPPPIQFPSIQAQTEQDTGGHPTALPPERRIGFAIVGLGRLALEEIMPAFAECKLAKPTALVSGDSAKANQIAQQYGIKPQNVYSYQNYDNLHNNPDVDVIYIVLPNSMHAEYTVRGQKQESILCAKSRWQTRLRNANR